VNFVQNMLANESKQIKKTRNAKSKSHECHENQASASHLPKMKKPHNHDYYFLLITLDGDWPFELLPFATYNYFYCVEEIDGKKLTSVGIHVLERATPQNTAKKIFDWQQSFYQFQNKNPKLLHDKPHVKGFKCWRTMTKPFLPKIVVGFEMGTKVCDVKKFLVKVIPDDQKGSKKPKTSSLDGPALKVVGNSSVQGDMPSIPKQSTPNQQYSPFMQFPNFRDSGLILPSSLEWFKKQANYNPLLYSQAKTPFTLFSNNHYGLSSIKPFE